VHIPVKTTADYDSNLPLETIQKQPLAMSKSLFSDRPQSTQSGHRKAVIFMSA
jgi:hypothetical protein